MSFTISGAKELQLCVPALYFLLPVRLDTEDPKALTPNFLQAYQPGALGTHANKEKISIMLSQENWGLLLQFAFHYPANQEA